jgi:sugar/nucleoside kinase (ribokinase family)
MAEHCEIAVLKLGERGSMIAHQGEVFEIAPRSGVPAVDTTGAGDLWASGFLYGLVSNLSIEESGELGSLCGYEVCQVVGAKIPDEGWRRIRAAAGIEASGGWLESRPSRKISVLTAAGS